MQPMDILKLTGAAPGERGAQEHNEEFNRLYPQLARAADAPEGYARQTRMIAQAKADDLENRARQRRADQAAAQGRKPERGTGFDGEGEWRGGERRGEPVADRVERQVRAANEARQMQEAREARAVREKGGERINGAMVVTDASGRIVSADPRAEDHFSGRRDIAGIEPSFLPVRTRLYLDAQTRNRLPGQRDVLKVVKGR
jgi:hypothetical protein